MSARPQVLICHGWALTPQSLSPLVGALRAAQYTVYEFDLGYYGSPKTPRYDPAQPLVLIGHSFGMWHLMEMARNGKIRVAGVISLGGFTVFPVPTARIRALRRKVVANPVVAVKDFLRQSAIAVPGPFVLTRINQTALLRDLDCMATQTTLAPPAPSLWYMGEDDAILAPFIEDRSQFCIKAGRNHDLGTGEDENLNTEILAFLATQTNRSTDAIVDWARV